MSATLGTEYHDADWPHGLRCADCDRVFVDGQPIAERLTGFQDDVPMLLIVCQECDLSHDQEHLGVYDAGDPWLNETCRCGHIRYRHVPGGEAGTQACTECACEAFSLPSHDQEQP